MKQVNESVWLLPPVLKKGDSEDTHTYRRTFQIKGGEAKYSRYNRTTQRKKTLSSSRLSPQRTGNRLRRPQANYANDHRLSPENDDDALLGACPSYDAATAAPSSKLVIIVF